MTLTDEQRAGLAKFLCLSGYAKEDGGWHWFPDHPHPGKNYFKPAEDQMGELPLALLERTRELGYYAQLSCPHMWVCYIDNFDGRKVAAAQNPEPAKSVILAVLQLPEARP